MEVIKANHFITEYEMKQKIGEEEFVYGFVELRASSALKYKKKRIDKEVQSK